VSKSGDQVRSALFKQVPGGYVFRAPNPKVFGRPDHYLVNEAQRDEIVAIISPRRPMLLLAMWIGGFFFLALGAAVVSLIVLAPDYPITVGGVLIAAMLLVVILALHLSASRKLRRLQPLLAGTPRTDQRITTAEIRQALNKESSYRQQLRVGISAAIACVVSAAAAAVLAYLRNPDVSVFSDFLPLLFGFNAIIFGLSSALGFYRARQKKEHAEATEPAAEPNFSRVCRQLISGCALALVVVLAGSALVGVKREFSDRSQGLRYERMGEHDNAIASFSKAIEAEPKNSAAYQDRAKSYGVKGDQDHAIADYSKAIEIEPGNALVYRKRADAFRTKGAHANAIADYSKAIELDSKNALGYFFRGVSYNATKDSERAIADFTKAIEIKPEDSHAHYFRGVSYPPNKDSDRAIADFTKAIELNPKDVNSYSARAQRFAARSDYDHAIADFSKAIEINPKYYFAYVSRGNVFAAKDEHDRAIADFTKAIEIEPKNALAYKNRVLAYTRTGANSLAIADYNTILELPAATDADRQWQAYARRRIVQLTSAPLAPEGSTNTPTLTPR
jgi:tetratricopeptide (TPR) repeat protein